MLHEFIWGNTICHGVRFFGKVDGCDATFSLCKKKKKNLSILKFTKSGLSHSRKSCSHKGEKSGDSLLCVGKEQSCLIQLPPSSRSLILSNFSTKLLWNVPRHRCAARQAASTPQWTRDKRFCICLAECWNGGTWERKAIRREWNARWWRITGEIHTRAAVPTVGTSKSCTGYLKHEPSSPTSPIPGAHPPVAQVPDEIRVVHLQLLSRHIRSEVLGRTARYNVRYHLMKQQTKGPSLAYVTLKICSHEFFFQDSLLAALQFSPEKTSWAGEKWIFVKALDPVFATHFERW